MMGVGIIGWKKKKKKPSKLKEAQRKGIFNLPLFYNKGKVRFYIYSKSTGLL